MADRIHVNSFGALEELEIVIRTFSTRFAEVLEDADRNIARKREIIDDVVTERQRRVVYCEREYEEADPDEDDTGEILNRLEEAQDELHDAQRWQKRIEDLYSSYSQQAGRLAFLCTEDARKAHAVLRQKINDLNEYAELSEESGEPGVLDAVLGAAEQVVAGGVSTIEASVDSLSNFLLPPKFEWISLDRIEPADLEELPTDEEFKKMPKEDMTAGMNLLRSRILPEMQRDPNLIGSDYFWEVDQREGRTGVNSLKNIYDAYFGGERMRVEPSSRSGYYNLDHGRHRLKLAKELGWTMVPALVRSTTYSHGKRAT
jgi:hypothetical protein